MAEWQMYWPYLVTDVDVFTVQIRSSAGIPLFYHQKHSEFVGENSIDTIFFLIY